VSHGESRHTNRLPPEGYSAHAKLVSVSRALSLELSGWLALALLALLALLLLVLLVLAS
jgi:hypothetical protein